jgi:amino acid transporter
MSNITNGSSKSSGLKNSYLSGLEVLAQSIAGIGPSVSPALVIPLVFGFAGNGTWLAYLFGFISILLVGANINQFTKRSASPGNLYAFIVKGLGTEVGVISGWALVLAYILTASAVLCGFINYANVLLSYVGFTSSEILIGILGALVAWYIAVKDIKLSARIMILLEGISIALIVLLAVIVLAKHGFPIDHAQFTLQGVSPTGLGMGLVLAFFSFVGFESATSLGDEAKSPLKTIPKAVTISVLLVGVIFILLSYTEVLGFAGSATALNEAAAPLTDLSDFNGIGFFGPLISIGALISFWACFLACTNAGARVLYLMGQHGIFNSSIGNSHDVNKTPHIAITISTIIASVVPFILILNNGGLFEIYGWTGTVATYGFILTYALIAISAPLYLYREKELKTHHIVLSAITILILTVPIVGSVYSNASSGAPYSWFIFVFVGWLVIGGFWYFIRKIQSPDVGNDISSQVEDVHQHFRNLRNDSEAE